MTFDFSGKLAVVTGGANGIGLAAARALAAGGATVWIFDLERERPRSGILYTKVQSKPGPGVGIFA